MATGNYYAVRFKSIPDQIRIEKAATPFDAFRLAFGGPPLISKRLPPNSQWKDLGSRVDVIKSDKKRIAALTDPKGWKDFK